MAKTSTTSATRGARFLAKLVDKAIAGIPLMFVAQNALGSLPFEQLMETGIPDEQKIAMMLPIVIHAYLLGGAVLLAVFIVQAVFLTRDGQTLGKKALGIRIVLQDTGKNGGFVTNVLLRTLLNGLLNAVPLYALLDALFIFRDDRRCIHDLIASTVVVKA